MSATPAGYHVMLVVAAHVNNPFVKNKPPFDVIGDFTPVTLVAASP